MAVDISITRQYIIPTISGGLTYSSLNTISGTGTGTIDTTSMMLKNTAKTGYKLDLPFVNTNDVSILRWNADTSTLYVYGNIAAMQEVTAFAADSYMPDLWNSLRYVREASLGTGLTWSSGYLTASASGGVGDVTKVYVDGSLATKVNKAGDTITGVITLNASLNVGSPSKSTRNLNVGSSGIYTDGNLELALNKYFFIGPTADSGNRFKLFTSGGHAYFDYYDELRFRSGASSSSVVVTFTNAGAATFSGALAASNLSGTNTGDQTNISGNAATATDADKLDGQHGSYYQPASSAITTSNIGSQSVNYATSAGNADYLDNQHGSYYATQGQTMYIGTTGVAINRGSASMDLAGIGTLSVGTVNATGEVTAYYSSDASLKTDIHNFTALDIINRLKPKTFKWNDTAKELNPTKDDRLNYGLIAQETEKVIPEIVHPIYEKYKAVDYIQLVPILVKAIQELQDEINYLKQNQN